MDFDEILSNQIILTIIKRPPHVPKAKTRGIKAATSNSCRNPKEDIATKIILKYLNKSPP